MDLAIVVPYLAAECGSALLSQTVSSIWPDAPGMRALLRRRHHPLVRVRMQPPSAADAMPRASPLAVPFVPRRLVRFAPGRRWNAGIVRHLLGRPELRLQIGNAPAQFGVRRPNRLIPSLSMNYTVSRFSHKIWPSQFGGPTICARFRGGFSSYSCTGGVV
jgi:hypothetical protein